MGPCQGGHGSAHLEREITIAEKKGKGTRPFCFFNLHVEAFASVAWNGAKIFYQNQHAARQLAPKLRNLSLSRKEYRLIYHNTQDWKKIIPLLFWWKVLPLSVLYIPLYLLVNPNLLPNSFDIATLAQMVISFIYFFFFFFFYFLTFLGFRHQTF